MLHCHLDNFVRKRKNASALIFFNLLNHLLLNASCLMQSQQFSIELKFKMVQKTRLFIASKQLRSEIFGNKTANLI